MSQFLTVYRNEKKYLVSQSIALRIQDDLSKLLMPDPYSVDGYYQVRSLYFDSLNSIDFYQKDAGVQKRKKVRLRVYSPYDEYSKLELKEKNGDYQHKSSLLLTRGEALAIQNGDYSVLLDKKSELACRLYTIMTLGVYSPVALIEYDRRAFVYDEFNTRITFDTAIKSSEFDMDVFELDPAWNEVMSDATVLEVKYDDKLFKPISEILKKYNIVNSSYSKYANGRRILENYV